MEKKGEQRGLQKYYSYSQKWSLFLFAINFIFLIAYIINDFAHDGTMDSVNWGGIMLSAGFGLALLWFGLTKKVANYTA